MAGTFSQIYLHAIFAVSGRRALIESCAEDELHAYLSAIVSAKGQKALCVGGMPDHVHLLLNVKPSIAPSVLLRDVKNNSSKFMKKFAPLFSWQEGFGIFSCAQSQLATVRRYILSQKEHHRQRTFKDEYLDFLKKYQVAYDPRFVFDE
jgi:REP element-mobilizing transposase RayT